MQLPYSFLIVYTLNPTNLYHYILRFVLFITWLLPCVTKAAAQSNVKLATFPTTINTTCHPYPRSIQLRSGLMVHNYNEKSIIVIPTTIDLDILYIHSFFASQFQSYPRVGLSFLMPYALQKEQPLRFPNIWGISAYIELYQSHPTLSTWGNRISIGAIKDGTKDQPHYSFIGIKEIIYHWLWAPSWQLNFGIGLNINQANTTDPLHSRTQPLHNADNENDAIRLKLAPIATIGIRYITHTEPFLRRGNHPIHYRKRKSSRVDCSIAGSSRRLAATKAYYLIFRGSSLFSFTINSHNALLCAMELGYNRYKKALLNNMLPAGGIEVTALLGYEIRYGHYLLQLQLGYEMTDLKKPTTQTANEDRLLSILNRKYHFSINVQYMLTERFFVGISARHQEIPAFRLGVSW
ncbi:hypothetical protein [Cardinium endosymbiont of Oedothorax gibbosus]|uniref:hypothetical protein n=1 Tax=Cardinium endosymbiont of Oedothorax gibbosus TaxID=931101 RepID=UPI0020258E78|nr:hypothetical protein [Cardinium endosymbiont of Oedothorax gibbosus]